VNPVISPWPFEDRKDTAVFTSKAILNGSDWIYYVTHDSDDGAWQFHPYGGLTPEQDAVVVSLGSIVDMDSSILALADLPRGWHAWRESRSATWNREPKGE
jgi:hypothetical protein